MPEQKDKTELLSATRKDVAIAKPTGDSSMAPFLQLGGVVLVFFILFKLVAPKLIPQLKKRYASSLGARLVIEETTNLCGGHLHIIKIEGKRILVGQTAQHFTVLSPVEEDSSPEPAFLELIDQADGEKISIDESLDPQPTHAVVNSREVVDEQLKRLQKLIGS